MTRDALDSKLNSDPGRLRSVVHLDGEGDGRCGLREWLVSGYWLALRLYRSCKGAQVDNMRCKDIVRNIQHSGQERRKPFDHSEVRDTSDGGRHLASCTRALFCCTCLLAGLWYHAGALLLCFFPALPCALNLRPVTPTPAGAASSTSVNTRH